MPRVQNTARRARPKPEKTLKRGTPVRNSILLLLFAGLVAVMVLLLPKEPTRQSATVISPDGAVVAGTPANLALKISEVMASNRNAYPDETGQYPDWIEIQNTSDAPINLEGVGLSDRDDRVLFLFPDVELEAGGYVIVYCDDINKALKGHAYHARFKISSLGETIFLFDPGAIVLDSVQVPALNSDVSYALTPSGYIITEQYTPGYANDGDGYTAFRSLASSAADGFVLNEIVASNLTIAADEDGEYSDWIELYNGGALPIDLSNYALSDDVTNPVKWRFPQGAVLKPGEYYVVFASGKNRAGGNGALPHTSFRLAADGETVVLSTILSQTVDQVTYDNLGDDESYGRVPGLEFAWQVYTQPTFGMANNRTSELEMDRRMRARNTSGVFISEVVTVSSGVETPFGRTSYDWIELYNASNTEVNLLNWGLSDSVGRPRKWQFPDVTIKPGEYLLVFPSGLSESPTGSSALHATFRLSALGENVVLSDPTGYIYDKLVVPQLDTNTSYGRNFDQGGLFYYDTPTGGGPNTTRGFAGYAAMPKIDQRGTLITRPTTVTITAPKGVLVRYTLDGTMPTETMGTDYTGPITIDSGAVVRARGFEAGLKPSLVATESFLFNAYHIMPVISVTVDPDDLWNPLTGIYAEGDLDESAFEKVPFKKTTYRIMKNDDLLKARAGNFEYFTPEGDQLLNQGVAVQLHGQFSLDLAQKSLRITAKSRYGSTALAYPFFDDRPFTTYQSIILRNGGNDGIYAHIGDALQSRIVDWTDSDIIHMAYTPCIVYLNGDYWGLYDLRERINASYIAMYEGWGNPDAIDLIKADKDVLNGNMKDMDALRAYVKSHDLNDPVALEKVKAWVDVDNCFDFYIFETYFGNTDPGNIKYYRERKEGAKWRWVLFDLDWGYFDRKNRGFKVWLDPKGASNSSGAVFDNSIIVALLKVPEMKEKFLERYAELWPILSDAERTLALLDEMVAEIEPEMGLHFNRWAGETRPTVAIDPYLARDNPVGYWKNRISRLKNVINGRPYHVYTQMQEWFELSDDQMLAYFGPCPEETVP